MLTLVLLQAWVAYQDCAERISKVSESARHAVVVLSARCRCFCCIDDLPLARRTLYMFTLFLKMMT
jgi:hypothetical protein